jgi:antitoxin PrlF
VVAGIAFRCQYYRITCEEPVMKPSISKLTSKYQATIPEPVRKALHLGAGDSVVFEVTDSEIRLRKAVQRDLIFAAALEGTLEEWNSDADDEAYRDL